MKCAISLCLTVLVFTGVTTLAAQSPNADATYQQLRNIGLGSESYTVDKATLKRDVATFQLNSGVVCFLPPVQGKVTGLVFEGEGRLLLTPPVPWEEASLSLLTRQKEYSESFNHLVVRFTDNTYQELKTSGKATAGGSCDGGMLQGSQHVTRKKLHYNLDARILQDVLGAQPGGLFFAFVHGRNYNDKTLFIVDPHGAPGVQPEEIELMTYDENKAGVWAAFHYTPEYAAGLAKGSQKNGVVHIEHQQLDVTIDKIAHLSGTATATLVAKQDGVRVVPFNLFHSLRVSQVKGGDGQPLNFIQEDKLEDPQFWVVLNKPLAAGESYNVTTTYDGKDAVMHEGTGNYYPNAREDWYPNSAAGGMGEYTNYDMTLRIPKGMKMAATGNLVKEGNQGDYEVSVWKSESPLTVAGFNFGKFKLEEAKLDKPDVTVLSYANEEPPDWVKGLRSAVDQSMSSPFSPEAYNGEVAGGALGLMSTTPLCKKALAEGELSLRIYSDYFGPAPYKRLEITQQTATSFGQSWPGLVYLPMTYLFDTTTRHTLGNIMRSRFPQYADDPFGYFSVVAPHEVAHQWWGHAVGFNSYRDQWMSEGFADMSAGLYLQLVYAREPQKAMKFWNDERQMLLERNPQGFRAIDAGPLIMGYRVSNSREGFDSYRRLIYPKGAYVLYMLRQMMWDQKGGDQRFKDTMHDFVATYSGSAATTEDFKAIVEKHMSPDMDLTRDHRMDWFFNEYVYGTQLPAYKFDYNFETGPNGDVVFAFKLTQSGVDQNFRMPVPVYLELANGTIFRLGSAKPAGNMTVDQKVPLNGLKEKPRRAMINYYDDVLAAN